MGRIGLRASASRLIPLKVAAVYLGFTVLWLFLSDRLLQAVVVDQTRIIQLEIYKDGLFMLLSAILLALLTRYYLREIQAVQTQVMASEAQYRRLIETAPEAIVVLDLAHGRFVEHNLEAERLFEMTGGELARHGPADLSPEFQPDGQRSTDKAMAYIRQAMEGAVLVFEWMHRSRSRREIPCEIRLMRLPAVGVQLVRGTITDPFAQRCQIIGMQMDIDCGPAGQS